MDRTHTISLVIPAHNEEKYIGACLDHIVRHATGSYEIIVVDNASTDRTAAVAASYPGVQVIREERKGVMRARERGFIASSGDIIAFIDADTRMPAGWTDRVRAEFAADESLVCFSGPHRYYDMPKLHRMLVAAYWYVLAKPMYWLIGYMAMFGNLAIRRDTLEKMGGLDTAIEFYGDDTNTARRACRFGTVKFSLRHTMPSSARRLSHHGFLPMFKTYALNFLSEIIRHKPVTSTYTDIR